MAWVIRKNYSGLFLYLYLYCSGPSNVFLWLLYCKQISRFLCKFEMARVHCISIFILIKARAIELWTNVSIKKDLGVSSFFYGKIIRTSKIHTPKY